jgi:hypothetical protein
MEFSNDEITRIIKVLVRALVLNRAELDALSVSLAGAGFIPFVPRQNALEDARQLLNLLDQSAPTGFIEALERHFPKGHS